MLLHYFTLFHVAAELRAKAIGAYCTACFTQEKNTLHFVFEQPARGGEIVLECGLDSRHGAFLLKPDFHRSRKNTLDCFQECIGRTLEDVVMMRDERVMVLHLPPYTVHCIPFAGWNAVNAVETSSSSPSPSNAVCTDAEGRIVSAFRTPQSLVGTPFRMQSYTPHSLEDVFARLPSETPLHKVLSQSDQMLGTHYAWEVIARLGLTGAETLADETVQAAKEDIVLVAEDVRRECLATSRFYVLRAEQKKFTKKSDILKTSEKSAPATSLAKPLLSMIHLTGSALEQEFASISKAIQAAIMLERREARLHGLHKTAQERVQYLLTKAERALEHINRDTTSGNRAMERQLWAELLLAQVNTRQKGLESITVHNWDGEELEIRLNPALSLRENAEELFAKAARAKEAAKRRETRQRQYADEIKRLRHFQETLKIITAEAESETTMESMIEAMMNDLKKNAPDTSQHKKTKRFREFPLDEAHTLYVGKTAADNDELTVRFAKPQDYWFHARGVPGSHAVLRISGGQKQKPPKLIMEQAAAIAAYFSKARNAKLAPVAYTQKKFVRKPKGAATGAVVMEREEVVMVRPHVPEGLLGIADTTGAEDF
jgi:predicted ribosome quality control (RQC) complex YloA/Tae2 family protein